MGRNKAGRSRLNSVIPGKSGEPPTWAVATVVVTIGFVIATAWLLETFDGPRNSLPFGNSDYFYVGLIALPMVALLAAMVAVKLADVRRAKSWSETAGRVVVSTVKARHHQFAGEPTTVRNEPLIRYEFTVADKLYRGSRIAIGDDSGGANTEATLERFPEGATVTVYFDPADPTNCVLERGVPDGVARGCAVLLALAATLVGAGYFLLTTGLRVLAQHVPPGRAPITMALACFGAFVLYFFFAFRSYSRRAANWPAVKGAVVRSGVERLEKVEDGCTRVTFAPTVEYGYSVSGIEYRSRTIKLGVTMASGSQTWAERVAA
jgi:hypothetical protein